MSLLKEKISEFVLDIKPELSKSQIDEFSKELTKEIAEASLILLGFTVLGILIGIGVELIFNSDSIPFYLLGLIPWLTGIIGGFAVYRWYGPKTRALLKKHLGSQ